MSMWRRKQTRERAIEKENKRKQDKNIVWVLS